MYPFFELFGITIYMTGIGVVVFVLTFVFLMNFYAKRYNVNFWRFFNWLPVFLILPYFFGSYLYHLFDSLLIIPLSINDLMLILSPYGYDFSFIGISLGLFLSTILFLKNVDIKNEQLKWIDIIFYSLSLALVPFGFFLLLGDDFIGQPTNSFLGVSALIPESFIYRFDQVYPVGLILSLVSILCFVLVFSMSYVLKKYGVGLLGFILLLLMLNFIFQFQLYSHNFGISMFGYNFDVKNYWTLILSGIILFYYFRYIKSKEIYNKNKG
ncbi:hypothetical protein [Candidatus Absconditicoccus praedator]|uniref:hypothetical protein n=1 Tax=Candidatus Absconditicoccus praedator TaxID=2735562 RepID=UPI001E3D674E|nr:hypothetical protein [Candidatus Absconditicoccus praedator]UFX82981.1 hypothetical protein HLG78_02500 [Candidatus Absconditicoccus praedator]